MLVEKVRMVASSLLVVYYTLGEIFGYRICVYRLQKQQRLACGNRKTMQVNGQPHTCTCIQTVTD